MGITNPPAGNSSKGNSRSPAHTPEVRNIQYTLFIESTVMNLIEFDLRAVLKV